MSDGNIFPEKPLRFGSAGGVCGHSGNHKCGQCRNPVHNSGARKAELWKLGFVMSEQSEREELL